MFKGYFELLYPLWVVDSLNLRLKTYGKLYTEFLVQKNMPSIRHELKKISRNERIPHAGSS